MRIEARSRLIGCLLLAVALLAATREARAVSSCLTDEIGVRVGDAPFLCGRASGQASSPDGIGTPSTTHGTGFLGLVGGSTDIAVFAPGGIGATAHGSAEFGLLRAFSQGFPGSYDATTGTPTAQSYALAEVSFGDRVVLTSTAAPLGTPVVLTAIVSVDGAFGLNGGAGLVNFYLGNAGSNVQRQNILLVNANPAYYAEFALNSRVGDEIYLRLGIRAASGAVNGPTPSVGFADMTSTGEVFLRAETPGLGFQAVSGHSYAIVPEPGSAMLAFPFLLAMLGRRRAKLGA